MASVLVDNDILYKTAMYGLISQLTKSQPFGATEFSMLGAAKYIILRKLSNHPPKRGREVALAEFAESIAVIGELEPSAAEVQAAAELEYVAKQHDLELDAGESILCAVLLSRNSSYIFTGDKRAAIALATLFTKDLGKALAKRLVCLEQLFEHLVRQEAHASVRAAVCAEASVDKALSNCFSCSSSEVDPSSWIEGLSSYIASLRKLAPNVLRDAD
jgi:hypothetical protein